MTALIATTTDTMTTRITSKAAIMEPKNRAASTSPITADAINSAASPALSCQNRRGGGERISCASGSRQLPFCSSSRPGESGSAAQASPDEYFKAIIAPIAVPLPWRGVRVFARPCFTNAQIPIAHNRSSISDTANCSASKWSPVAGFRKSPRNRGKCFGYAKGVPGE